MPRPYPFELDRAALDAERAARAEKPHVPSWANIEERSLHCPYLRILVEHVRRGADRETSLIQIAISLSKEVQKSRERMTDMLRNQPPSPIIKP